MKETIRLILSVAAIGFGGAAMGLSPARADDAVSIRQIDRMTEEKRWSAAAGIAARSSSLVKNYYEWLNLQREDTAQDFFRYADFLKNHGDWPAARRIRANAERVMPPDWPPDQVLDFYRTDEPVTARGMIAWAKAAHGSGQDPRPRLHTWFASAHLSLDEQKNILATLRKDLNTNALRQRLDYLINAKNTSGAQALARVLGADDLRVLAVRQALASRRRGADAALANLPQSRRFDPGLIADRLEYLRRQNKTAAAQLELFRALPADFRPYDQRGFWQEQQALIYRLLAEKNFAAAYQVAARPIHEDRFARGQAEWMAGYIALSHLRQPGRAFRHFESLYKTSVSPLSRARAAYWAGAASDRLDYPDVARAWYRSATAYRGNFYGQLAATKIPAGQGSYRQGPPVASADDRAAFSRSELPSMARALVRAGDTAAAEQFVVRLADVHAGRGGLMRLTIDLALELKLTSLAVKLSRAAAMEGVDFADYVYPTLDAGAGADVERALVYAVIRQESGFDVDAVSSVGAKGLMQLMPATAKAVARAEGVAHNHVWLTARPAHNVRLGSAYLRQLVDQYQSYALVAAAYNAGPGRVNEWLRAHGDPRRGEIDLVDWIERIPFYETRNYVQRILEGAAVYRQKLPAGDQNARDPLHLGKVLRQD